MSKMIERKITREKNQYVVERKATRIRSSDAGRAVVQHETSEEIRSSELIHSEVLQETLEGKHRNSGLLRAEVLNVRTVRKS